MEAGQVLLILAIVFLVFDVLLLSRKNTRKRKSTFYVSIVAFFLIIETYLLFVQAFLVDDFSITEVYMHSSSSLPLVSKVYAAWAGGGGSLLLLTLCLSAVYFGFRVWTDRKPEEVQIFSSRVMCIVTAFFLVMCIFKNPFATFEIAPQEGGGLNPALQTPWMAVHPPIVFIAYAFLSLAFVLVLAGMRTGKQTEEKLLRLSTRVSWLFFTIGIALGGLWAYEVLGWGGYWSWDPIETSSLLPWFALTVFFHFDRMQSTKRTLSREFMILLAFDALIFLSALTRGGLLSSVHAYAFSPAGPVLLLFALGVTVYFVYLKRKTGKNLLQLNYDKTSTEALSIFLDVLATLAIFIVCFVGVAAPLVHSLFTTEPFTPSTGFYNIGTLPFVLTLLVAFIVREMPGKVGAKSALPIIAIVIMSALFVAAGWPTTNWLSNLALPFAIAGLAALVLQLMKNIARKTRFLRAFGLDLLHIGLALTLVGVFISGGAAQRVQVAEVQLGQPREILGIQMVFDNAISEISSGDVELSDGIYPEYISLRMDASVTQAGNDYHTFVEARLYPALGIVIAPTIVRTLSGDIYIHVDQSDALTISLMTATSGNFTAPESLDLTVKTIPWVNLVWAGSALLSIGVSVILAKEFTSPNPKHPENKIEGR